MTKPDYYDILNLERSASAAEIKAAFRKSALQHHPDRNAGDPEAEEKFKLATEAYEVLSDAKKKQIYDQFGHAGLAGQGFQGRSDVEDIFSTFGSIFEDFFGFSGGNNGQKGQRARRGADMRYDLNISFIEAMRGCEQKITFQREEDCGTCHGNGKSAKSKEETCRTCGGNGQLRRNQGFFSVAVTCHSCNGEGKQITNPCTKCKGSGRGVESRTLTVKIPAGVDSGVKLRISGEGQAGSRKGPAGDLYVFIEVEPSDTFSREGDDLYLVLPVPMVHAALGTEVEIPTLDEAQKITIPAGSQFGDDIRLRGKGVPRLQGVGRGDLIIRLKLEVPKKLNKEQRRLLEEFAKTEEAGGSGFFKKWFE
jgi:molecular chaperone DnaJ